MIEIQVVLLLLLMPLYDKPLQKNDVTANLIKYQI